MGAVIIPALKAVKVGQELVCPDCLTEDDIYTQADCLGEANLDSETAYFCDRQSSPVCKERKGRI